MIDHDCDSLKTRPAIMYDNVFLVPPSLQGGLAMKVPQCSMPLPCWVGSSSLHHVSVKMKMMMTTDKPSVV